MLQKTLLFLSILFTIFACSKQPGPGGKANVNVHVINGNTNVPESTVYVNYGGTSFPGESATGDANLIADAYFICGPGEMIDVVEEFLLERGVDKNKIKFYCFYEV